jgi:plasmid maintenance system killer protein
MILRFRHRGLERLYSRGDTGGVSAQHVKRLRAALAALATASVPSDMAVPGCIPCVATARAKGRFDLRQLARDFRV